MSVASAAATSTVSVAWITSRRAISSAHAVLDMSLRLPAWSSLRWSLCTSRLASRTCSSKAATRRETVASTPSRASRSSAACASSRRLPSWRRRSTSRRRASTVALDSSPVRAFASSARVSSSSVRSSRSSCSRPSASRARASQCAAFSACADAESLSPSRKLTRLRHCSCSLSRPARSSSTSALRSAISLRRASIFSFTSYSGTVPLPLVIASILARRSMISPRAALVSASWSASCAASWRACSSASATRARSSSSASFSRSRRWENSPTLS
mmetsp:Transcript_7768/g.22684  ORF Transcript_7768/g.22684 Transcript_7768/m.22684 type:complete len:273 (-) Transcript_7768:207-1025(-)